MKTTVLALLPLAGVALAEYSCSRRTVTFTEYEKVYETVSAAEVEATTESSSCSRKTTTATTYEKVYVTVTAGGEEDSTSTSTSTAYITTTVIVRPSIAPPYSNSSTGSHKPLFPTSPYMPSQPEQSPVYTPTFSSEPVQPTPEPEQTSEATTSTSAFKAPAEPTPSPEPEANNNAISNRGDATFYGGNVAGGMCSFTNYTIPSGLFGTALSDFNWASGSNCGACISVTGPSGNKLKAMVVDQCPGCGPNHLDLFPDAFAKLADPSKGVIPVSWEVVPCGITSPLVLKNKEGTSRDWFSMQVQNANIPVAKLDVSVDGNKTWMGTTRKEYNYFEKLTGFGTDSVDVRITSASGDVIMVGNMSVAASSNMTAGGNFA